MSAYLSRFFGFGKRTREVQIEECSTSPNSGSAAPLPKRGRYTAISQPEEVDTRRDQTTGSTIFTRMGQTISRFAERFVKTGERGEENVTPNGGRITSFNSAARGGVSTNGRVFLGEIDLTQDEVPDEQTDRVVVVRHNPAPKRGQQTSQRPSASERRRRSPRKQPASKVFLEDGGEESDSQTGRTTVTKIDPDLAFGSGYQTPRGGNRSASSRWSRRLIGTQNCSLNASAQASRAATAPIAYDVASTSSFANDTGRLQRPGAFENSFSGVDSRGASYYSPTIDLDEKRRYAQLLDTIHSPYRSTTAPPDDSFAKPGTSAPANADTTSSGTRRPVSRASLERMNAARQHVHNILVDLTGDDSSAVADRGESPEIIDDERGTPKASTSGLTYERRPHSDLWLDTSRLDELSDSYGKRAPVDEMLRDIDARQVTARNRRREAQQKEQVAIVRREMVPKAVDELNARLRDDLLIDGLILPITPSKIDDDFQPLTETEEDRVDLLLQGGPQSEVLCSAFSIDMKRKDLLTLHGTTWLNDEVINFYMQLITQRSTSAKARQRKYKPWPRCHAFNTFFCRRLMETGYSSIRRWTKKVDVFTMDVWLVPVHVGGIHWTLATVDLRQKTIKYFDSMGGGDGGVLDALLRYVQDEHKDKKKSDYDVALWSTRCVKDGPRQENGSDCGVFTCKTADFVSRDKVLTFSQKHIPMFRHRMVLEIVDKRLFT